MTTVDVDPDLRYALTRPAAQQPRWHDDAHRLEVLRLLDEAPPLTSPDEVDRLAVDLAAVARGEAFLLHGGDCAETFSCVVEEHIRGIMRTLSQMAGIIERGAGTRVVRLGRLAGQYAKPRSVPVDPSGIPAYRGDMVNALPATDAARTHDPRRMLQAFAHAAVTMNFIRTLGPDEELYVSHEALVLDYEAALTRTVGARRYDLSAHALWIGERTRQLHGAHLAFMSLLRNPVGVKLGPTATPEEAVDYVNRLAPGREPGAVQRIVRAGAGHGRRILPPIVESVTATGHLVTWVCDPMHGNTWLSSTGHKTRRFDDIVEELRGFIAVHRELGTHPGGIHLELTGEDVTECLGGARGIDEAGLGIRYETACDPRLNREQSQELAFLLAAELAR
jgi:3-deoxy-D-arabino-heptulosonate 7-phosphate (DAHP) synthase class II